MRVLKNYRGFQQLAESSGRPFSVRGGELAEEIERVTDNLDELVRAILVNQYMIRPKDRLSRIAFCKHYGLTVKEYDQVKSEALHEFANAYLGGCLLELVECEQAET
ncbi:hypothetical protein [Streptococcus sp. 121]|uniref:hypothetical protein n=1 Tax=Streptococcus sp. 121 TaxID=2797637 RepID=UPI0018F0747E|nr:hypothetical protein [Streptococcus sp. 121]